PPSGVGVAVDAPFVSGGGFLTFDADKGQYAGVLQLTIQELVTVTAIGMITTRLPDGARGFSFVVMITAREFEPIQLGLGFTLTGVGGLLAINRTCNQDFLREGIKNKALNDLLFPDDPIRNAAQILGTLNSAFPPQPGSFLFGPAVQICWGTPPVVTMDLGLVLELGNRHRLIVLGRVAAIMPTEKEDLIRLQMNALGIIDLDQDSISLDAVLYDSRLVGRFPITGGMAMRLNWGSAPTFALSVGGFHPAFKPPPNFPTLDRLVISFCSTSSFTLRADSYLALTSNTLQWGAKAELLASAGGLSIAGRIGYDVLIQFDPFSFLADFHASVQLKHHSDNLFKVTVEGELSGPRPLHVKGKATFEIFWCDFSVGFDRTLVDGEAPPALPPVNVTDQLVAALGDARNWSGQLAEAERRMVTLRESPPDQIALHPLGSLSVRQRVVPLDLQIAKFGNAVPADATRFTITGLTIGGKTAAFDPVEDFFAPAQFLNLTDDEKLTAPSFEAIKAGLVVGAGGPLFTSSDGDTLDDPIEYETIIIGAAGVQDPDQPPAAPTPITTDFLQRHRALGAAGRSPLRRSAASRYRAAAKKNAVVRKGWIIASTVDGTPQGAPGLSAGSIVSYSEAFQALQTLKAQNPAQARTMMLVRTSIT
ncbi:MAG TPA: DUF6603 domain-containing protein, partial [Vicinamibacterales bacterium]|nr:DUF6603 domain-containing protein [Vicinamibacterales bacterium]